MRSDHLPLKKFLQKNTLNTKVNNWAVEISPYKIQFEYIKGIKNTLADTMSRLIQIDPEAKLCPEQDGYEFGYYAFEDMELIKCEVQEEIKLPLNDEGYKLSRQETNFAKTSVISSNKSNNKVETHTI